MNEPKNNDKIIAALRTVQPKRLMIIDLVNRTKIVNGELDYQELLDKQLEVKLAIEEAKVYSAHTLQAVDALARLGNKKRPDEPPVRVITEEDEDDGDGD
jgi:hypothetical protein